FAQSASGDDPFSIFAMVGMALIASWPVQIILARLFAMTLLRRRSRLAERKRGRCCASIAAQAKSGGMRPASTCRST
ncbi:MAG: hypothetical protein NZ523_05320, partial [Elioraea sp.]|nr:hypothetical protein [Elioraea sp.]